MKLKNIYLLAFLLLCAVYSCKTDEVINTEVYYSSNTMVKSFSLKSAGKDTIGYPLDSVYFTVDLRNKVIFNADSLPYGSKVNEAVFNISAMGASQVKIFSITDNKDGGKDTTTIDYIASPETAVTLKDALLRLEVVAANGVTKEMYDIKVNKHQVKSDSLFWGDMAIASMPVSGKSKTVKLGAKYYNIGQNGSAYYCNVTNSLNQLGWTQEAINGIGQPNVLSLQATGSKLYMLDYTGQLYSSSDGVAWNSEGVIFYSLLGALEDRLLGVVKNGTNYLFDIYPKPSDFNPYTVPSSDYFPVSGASNSCAYSNIWGQNTILFFGGVSASGKLSNAVWSYNSSNYSWAILNNVDLPQNPSQVCPISPRKGAMMFTYYRMTMSSSNGSNTETPALFVVGGEAAGEYFNDVYTSFDYGVTWAKAPQLLQLPKEISPRAYGSVLVENMPRTRSVSSQWRSVMTSQLPMMQGTQLRTLEEIPYIYILGGETKNQTPSTDIWRGVIRQFTFAPIP